MTDHTYPPDDRLDLLHRRLERDPDDPGCLMALGEEYARLGQDTRALAHLELLTAMDPLCAQAWVQKAICQHQTHDHEAAQQSVQQAFAIAEANGDHDAMDAARALAGRLDRA